MRSLGHSKLRDAVNRIRTAVHPNVTITSPPEAGIHIDWNVAVMARDGTILRANVFRPQGDGVFPVVMCAHPYNKDAIGLNGRRGHAISLPYRLFPQPQPITLSALTSWEAPDPVVWVALGFAVVNADLRGSGQSEGIGELLSDAEALDYYDLIEWAGHQPWSNGRVGLNGVSYLAISQYKVAGLQPPSLAAICPWEGVSDFYRDCARPGGVHEKGFLRIWSAEIAKSIRTHDDLFAATLAHTERDDWYTARTPKLENIQVPILVCGSFSDHSLHTRGSFEVFRRAGSKQKWLYTHRSGKWSTYYSDEAVATQVRFFEHFLKGENNGWQDVASVRIAVHEDGPDPAAVYHEADWPPTDLKWIDLALDASNMSMLPHTNQPGSSAQTSASFHVPNEHLNFEWLIPQDMDVIGPMALKLPISIAGGGDANLFIGVRKFGHHGDEAQFEGSYGYASDIVTKGWQRVAHREMDTQLSTDWMPVHTHKRTEPLEDGEVATVEIALLPQATRFRKGERLRLVVQGSWHFAKDPLRGQFPANYQPSVKAHCTLHTGGQYQAYLRLGWRDIVSLTTVDY